jgi:hypothetical protein
VSRKKRHPTADSHDPTGRATLYAALAALVVVLGAGLGALSQLQGLERFYSSVLLGAISVGAVISIAYFEHLRGGELVTVAALGAAAAAICGAFAVSGWNEHTGSNDASDIRSTIAGAAKTETAVFKAPSADSTTAMFDYYDRASTSLQEIAQVAQHFRQEHCHWAGSADELVDVQSVTIHGKDARARTLEYYHQPRVCTTPPTTPPLGDQSARVTYELTKGPNGWRIVSTSATYLK